MNTIIEIPISKKKIILLLIAGTILFILGIWISVEPEKFIHNIFRIENTQVICFWGIAGIVFFGLGIIYGIIKLFDKKAGLIIDSHGITDNTNASSIGLIEWNDINNIRIMQIMSSKLLLIDVDNPEKYIEKASNGIKGKLMRANMTICGTPLSITSNTLKCDFGKLEKLIRKEYEKNKNAR